MRTIIDASVVIHWLRTGDDLLEDVNGIISTVTIGELFVGASAQKGGKQRESILEILKGWKQISPSLETAILAGELRYKYRLALGDAFVVSLALEENLPLFTLDSGDFKKIKGLKFYK